MPAESNTTEHTTVEIRLTLAEHELLKRQALPNMTAWVRAELRKLPGGSDLPPLEAAPVVDRPKWRPDPLIVGGKPGQPAIQIAAFVAAMKGVERGRLLWKRWRPVHGLYEGLREVLARGDGLRSVWNEANRWRKDGEPQDSSREFFEALFKFADLKSTVKEWYDKKYKVSNAKRQRAKQKDPERYLARQRKYMADSRARKKASAAALERAARERQVFETFVSDHVTEHVAPGDALPVAAE